MRLATWSGVDRDGRLWMIPATGTKARREHRVPRSGAGSDVLDAALKDLNIAAGPHGFRSSFRDWAAEEADHPREVVEAALADRGARKTVR